MSLRERVQGDSGLGRPVDRGGSKRAGGQGLPDVIRAHLLGVVCSSLAPVCNNQPNISN